MIKQIVIVVCVLAVIIVGGIFEINILSTKFSKLEEEIDNLISLTEDETITESAFLKVKKMWEETREQVELFINHLDITEMDLRMAECTSTVKYKEYSLIHAQLAIIKSIVQHIPHTITPSPEHIL